MTYFISWVNTHNISLEQVRGIFWIYFLQQFWIYFLDGVAFDFKVIETLSFSLLLNGISDKNQK